MCQIKYNLCFKAHLRFVGSGGACLKLQQVNLCEFKARLVIEQVPGQALNATQRNSVSEKKKQKETL